MELPSVFDMATYGEVMTHIEMFHGETGKFVVHDQQQAPIMWHQLAHLDHDFGHTHEGLTPESVMEWLNSAMETMMNPTPEFIEQLEVTKHMTKEQMYQRRRNV